MANEFCYRLEQQNNQDPNNRKFIYCYPNISSSSVALYWEGISISAARANSVSFLDLSIFFDIISVKFTNCKSQKNTLVLNQTLTKNKSKIQAPKQSLENLPGSYQRHAQGCYHQILSSCPMAHLQHQLKQLTKGTHCKLQAYKKNVLSMSI